MASTSETGHAKNVANFKELITFVKNLGTQYQPMADTLKIDALDKMANDSETLLNELKNAETLAKQATAALKEQFKTLNTFTSQLMGLLKGSGASASSMEEARAIQKRITGANTKKKNTTQANATTTPPTATYSKSRQSYDSRLDDFDKFITVLQNIPAYKPNEDAFKITALQNKVQAMKQAIQTNDDKEIIRSQAMSNRNTLLYTSETNLVDVALNVKEYIKAAFGGIKSPQYKLINKINFRKIKD